MPRHRWNSPDRDITPERAAFTRRRFLTVGLSALGLVGAGSAVWYNYLRRGGDDEVLSPSVEGLATSDLYPAKRNPSFADAGRDMTPRADAARYTNFYEFSSFKDVWRSVGAFQTTPWQIEVTGLVSRPRVYDIDDILKAFPLEERVYRHRCVEAWAMVVPWTGFPLAELIRKAEPKAGATFVKFVSFDKPAEASGLRWRGSNPWPYTEGLTLAEATNPLAFIATGVYGRPLLKQHGAPVRLVVPWKYGFKSAKSLVRIELTDAQPATFWNTVQPGEYKFTANVEPEVPHPRWSQASERMLGTGERFATKVYNGYGEWVAGMYTS